MPKEQISLNLLMKYPYYYLFVLSTLDELFDNLTHDAPPRNPSILRALTMAIPGKANRALKRNRNFKLGAGFLEKLLINIPVDNVEKFDHLIEEMWRVHLKKNKNIPNLSPFPDGRFPERNTDFSQFSLTLMGESMRDDKQNAQNHVANVMQEILYDTDVRTLWGKGKYSLAQFASVWHDRNEPDWRTYVISASILLCIFVIFFAVANFELKVIQRTSLSMVGALNGGLLVLVLPFYFAALIALDSFADKAETPQYKNQVALDNFAVGLFKRHEALLNHETFSFLYSTALRVDNTVNALGIANAGPPDSAGGVQIFYGDLLETLLQFLLPRLDIETWKTYKPLLADLQQELEVRKEKAAAGGFNHRLHGTVSYLKVIVTFFKGQTTTTVDTVEEEDTEEKKENDTFSNTQDDGLQSTVACKKTQ